MPKSWYSYRDCDTEFDKAICANRKPYFMIYRYPKLRTEYARYNNKYNRNCKKQYGMTLDELIQQPELTKEQSEFIYYYYKYLPVDTQDCTMNRLCKHIEDSIGKHIDKIKTWDLDYEFLKYPVEYTQAKYKRVVKVYKYYMSVKAPIRRQIALGITEKDAEIALNKYIRDEMEKIDCHSKVFSMIVELTREFSDGKEFLWNIYPFEVIDRVKMIWEENNAQTE